MKPILCLALMLLMVPLAARAALPVEREVERHHSVSGTRPGQRVEPVGTIEYSSDGVSRRHFGPWVLDDAWRHDDAAETILQDGSMRREHRATDTERRHPDAERRCRREGNVTVCR